MAIPVYFESSPDVKLAIIDSAGNTYYLPKTFEVRSEPQARKMSLMDVAFTHGARDVSDGKMQYRVVEVSGKIWAESDAAFNIAWDVLAKEIIKENFRLQDRDRQINILRIQQVSLAFPSQVDFRYGEVSIQLLAADPFWYSKTAQQKQWTVTSSPFTFAFDVGGNADTFPVIIIHNNAANTDFKLENTTDGGREFRIQDAQALSGTDIVIDCAAGTVKRDGTDIIAKFSGRFLRLLGGRENQMKYTGANCTITIQYKEAYL